ncbi:MAG: DUF4199 domain-containing protein [Flavobacteriaceae bacterium]|nr:DUF4199 domain-containing protein [Flavobacteriaceae bacterium]
MNQKKIHPSKMGLIYGVGLGTVVVGFGIIRYKTGMILRDDHSLSYVYWVIFTLSMFYAVFQYRRLNPLSFSYKETMKIGAMAGLASGLLYTLYITILNNYFDTELVSKIIEMHKEAGNSTKVMKLNTTVRGLIYTTECMVFGIINSINSTFLMKKLLFKSS